MSCCGCTASIQMIHDASPAEHAATSVRSAQKPVFIVVSFRPRDIHDDDMGGRGAPGSRIGEWRSTVGERHAGGRALSRGAGERHNGCGRRV